MNHTFTDLHKNRYEWAFSAKREFINRFVRLDVQEILYKLQEDLEMLDGNELSFNRLSKMYSEAEEASKLELKEHEKSIEKFNQFIERQRLQINQELKEFNLKQKQISSEIENYKEFSMHLDKIMKEIKSIEIEPFVKEIITYDSSQKKASVLNGYASNLQFTVETNLEKQLTDIKAVANSLKITEGHDLRLPELQSIPRIYQKIDAFWLTTSYDKVFYNLLDKSIDWVVEMYKVYLDILTSIRNEIKKKPEQLLNQAKALRQMNDEKLKRLHKEIAKDEEIRDQLIEKHGEVYEKWKEDCEHAKHLQDYFIKHWLLYKEELQRHFLSGNVEERWFVTQYLQLLQQDGEKIIESLNS